MRRILIITLFQLTLLPLLLDKEYSYATAQNFAYENGSYWLPDIEVSGKDPSKITCDCCKMQFKDEEAFLSHLIYDYVCRSFYGINDEDNTDEEDDTETGTCIICGESIYLLLTFLHIH